MNSRRDESGILAKIKKLGNFFKKKNDKIVKTAEDLELEVNQCLNNGVIDKTNERSVDVCINSVMDDYPIKMASQEDRGGKSRKLRNKKHKKTRKNNKRTTKRKHYNKNSKQTKSKK